MSDQCKHCTVRGDIKDCLSTECFQHENWYAVKQQEHINELQAQNVKLQQANDEAQSLIGLLEIEVKKLKQDCRDLRIEVSMLTSSVGGKSYKQLMREQEQRDLEQQAKGVKDLKALLNGADWEDSELQMYLYHHIEDMKLKQVSELSK